MSDVIRETTMKIERETLSERACLYGTVPGPTPGSPASAVPWS